MSTSAFMNISEAARLSGLSSKMIRHYEETGLFTAPLRTAAGYRQFTRQSVEQLTLIHQAKRLGFSVAHIATLLALKQDPSRASREVKTLAQEQLQLLEQRLHELERMKALLTGLVNECAGDDSPHCTILDKLADSCEL